MTTLLLMTLWACNSQAPKPLPETTTTPGTTPTPTSRCPPPPTDAIVFQAGTVFMQQWFIKDPSQGTFEEGWILAGNGMGYEYEEACLEMAEKEDGEYWKLDVKRGERVDEFFFELAVTIPGSSVNDWLGLHGSGDGHLRNNRFAAHQLMLGWHDGDQYHWVETMPQGWTQSQVCVEVIEPDYIQLSVLFDPADGIYTRNTRNRLTQPIWFELEAWATGTSGKPQSCMQSVYTSKVDRDAIFATETKP